MFAIWCHQDFAEPAIRICRNLKIAKYNSFAHYLILLTTFLFLKLLFAPFVLSCLAPCSLLFLVQLSFAFSCVLLIPEVLLFRIVLGVQDPDFSCFLLSVDIEVYPTITVNLIMSKTGFLFSKSTPSIIFSFFS